jgi:thiamine biosynthesis lipoprotein
MGSDCHAIVVGGSSALLELAVDRIAELERRWSRFLPDSEISRLNEEPGAPFTVTDETFDLIAIAEEAHELTRGLFDALIGNELIAAGYDRPFDEVVARRMHPDTSPSRARPQRPPIVFDAQRRTVSLPVGYRFDPGGVGKGLAADIVVAELLGAGADTASIAIGGDVRVSGETSWTIPIAHPHRPDHDVAVVDLVDGAVCSSSTVRRQWSDVRGRTLHHVIDPRTGAPAESDVLAVSVLAANATTAEVLTTAVMVDGSDRGIGLVESLGAEVVSLTRRAPDERTVMPA